MEVAIDPRLSGAVLQQLVQENLTHTQAWQGIVADYAAALQRCRELQVRWQRRRAERSGQWSAALPLLAGWLAAAPPGCLTRAQHCAQPCPAPPQCRPPLATHRCLCACLPGLCRSATPSWTRRRGSCAARMRSCTALQRTPSAPPSAATRWGGGGGRGAVPACSSKQTAPADRVACSNICLFDPVSKSRPLHACFFKRCSTRRWRRGRRSCSRS